MQISEIFAKSGHAVVALLHSTGRSLYVVGIQTVRIARRLRRRCRRFFAPVTSFIARGVDGVIGRRVRAVKREFASIRAGFAHAGERIRAQKEHGFRRQVREFFHCAGRALVRHGGVLGGVVNIAAPVAAIALLVVTAQQLGQAQYGLELSYNGSKLGYVENENVVGQAVDMANARVTSAAEPVDLDVVPTVTFTQISGDRFYVSASNVCDKIIAASDGVIEEATGLYVDGTFLGSVKSETDLRFILQSILKQSETGDDTLEAAFVQDVELVSGMYPTSTVVTSAQMQATLTSTEEVSQSYTVVEGDAPLSIASKLGVTLQRLQSLNPDYDLTNGALHVGDKLTISGEKGFLTIKTVKRETYTKSIPYSTVKEKSSSLYIGSSKVSVKGQNGVEQVVDEVTYVDGVEVDRENISTTVLQASVNQKVLVGTKQRPTMYYYTGGGVTGSTGTLSWPVPSSRRTSQVFAYYGGKLHAAIDIVAPGGTAVYAADSGVVVSAGWNAGYGWNITIRHDNGIETFYAHCSRLYVNAGATVAKGQSIAAVGNTGYWSRGYHLHFGVKVNGTFVNPYRYVS